MALRAALLSMASTKEMKFYSTNSVGSEDDPTSDENFQLRLSDDEDCHNTEDGDNLLSKEAEEDILNKFKFDENDDKEESKTTDESSKDKDAKINDTNEDASKVAEEGKNEETSIESEVEDKKEEAIEESSEETKEMVTEDAAKNEEEIGNAEKETSDDLESPKSPKEVEKETLEDVECAEKPKETETEDVEKKTVTEDAEKETETEDAKKETETEDAKKETETEDAKKETSKSKNEECSESPKEEVETPMEEVETSKEEVETPKEEEEEKDSSKIENAEGSKDEKKEESATSSKDEKSEEDVQKEIFKRQTNDTENLLDILDVKPADENNLLQELKDPSSSSENNSEKDENEEECEDMDAEKMEEETEGPEVDEAMDSIDIEENVLVQEDTSGDLQNTDKETSEKIGTDTVFMETDKIAESEEDISKPDVSSDKREPVSSPPPPVDGVTCSEKTDASDETSEKVEQPGLTNEIKEDGSTKETIENESSSKSVKRSLPETTETDCEMEMAAKRIKMLEKKDYYDKPKPTADAITPKKDEKPVQNVETLNCLVEFMKTNVLTKLSRNNLEQLCLQKMCEAITDKSEIGELRHQLKVQEQMIEHWRKEVTQLTKQARDLETVNTRLMSDFRSRNEREKPIMPLKITRSVGLQVNPDNFILANRRKVVRNVAIAQNASTTTSATSPMKQTVVHTVAMTNGIPELVSTDKVTDTSVPASASSFIDLTDEDDKKTAAATNTKNNNNNNNKRRSSGTINNNNSSSGAVSGTTSTSPVKSVAATVVTSTAGNKSYRIVSPAVASGVTVNGAPRLMYVVNSNPVQGILTTTTPAVAAAPKTSSVLKINTNGLIGQTASMRSAASASRSQQSARPVQTVRPSTAPKTASTKASAARHPAPLPPTPMAQVSIASRKPVPPKPHLQIRKNGNAIVLSWKMPYNLTNFESIASYQLYAYQETSAPPSTDMWRKVGDIKALALPMACTLTQFADGNKYHFAVRAVDVLKRVGPFSEPGPILL